MPPLVLFSDSDGAYLRGFQLALLAGALLFFFLERRAAGLQYSKFVSPANRLPKLPGRIGFAILYLPSFIAALLFLAHQLRFLKFLPISETFELQGRGQDRRLRLLAVTVALAVHFGKRLLEVMFLHRFSGKIDAGTCIFISSAYAIVEIHILYAQNLSLSLENPSISLLWPGLGIFLLGIWGNFYHHYLLANLRKDGQNNGYSIPHGGLFEHVACPHYLFEIAVFWGIAFLSQTMTALVAALSVTSYLTGRSLHTREWYLKKMDQFPRHRKAIIPFLL